MKLEGALLDTNACLYLLKGQVEPEFEIEQGIVSIVTEVELLGYHEIKPDEEELITEFLALAGSPTSRGTALTKSGAGSPQSIRAVAHHIHPRPCAQLVTSLNHRGGSGLRWRRGR